LNQNKKISFLIPFQGGFFIIKEGKRKRYIGFIVNIKNNETIDKKELISEIKDQCKKMFDRDFKNLGLYLIKYNDKGMGIIRCKHTEKENTIKLLSGIKKIGSKKTNINTIATSGTIKTLIRKHMPDF
jgi:RNase P/RNase MRP subunit POP5